MAWTAPRTWAVGEVVTAAMQNTHVRDNLLYLKTHTDLYDAHDAADAQAAHVTLGAHGIGDHTDVTRYHFISTMGCYTDAVVTSLGYHQVVQIADGIEKYIHVEFRCPDDFVSITSFICLWESPAGAGKWLATRSMCQYGAVGELYDIHGADDTGALTHASGANKEIVTASLTGLFASIAKNDYCGLYFRRMDVGADTLNAVAHILGFLLTYTAEQ